MNLRDWAISTSALTHRHGQSPRGSMVFAAYSAVCAANTMLWLSFAAITSTAARHFGVSVGSIGLLAEIVPLLFVLLALPAGVILDWSLVGSLRVAMVLIAVGAVLRVAGGDFAAVIAGQVLIGCAQPVFLSAITKLAQAYLPSDARARGVAQASAVNFLGMVAGLTLGPAIGAGGHVSRLLVVEAVLAVSLVIWFAVALGAPDISRDHRSIRRLAVVRLLLNTREIRVLCGVVFVGFGLFVALVTWTQQLLKPAGVSQAGAGVLLVAMVTVGIVGSALIAPAVFRRSLERAFFRVATAGVFVAYVVLAAAGMLLAREVALVALGLFLLPGLPVVLNSCERYAGSASATAAALIWMTGNLGGLVVALTVQSLVHHPVIAFSAMAAISLLLLPLSRGVPSVAEGQRSGRIPHARQNAPAAAVTPEGAS